MCAAAGDTDVTVGGVLSTLMVVKLEVKLVASAFPAKSSTPELPPTIVTVYKVEPARAAEGVNVI